MKFARMFLKSISWRLIALAVTGTIAFVITGTLAFAVSIAGIDAIFKIGIYMFHEWLWERKRNDNTNKSG